MDYLGHKKLEKNNGIYSSIDGIQEVSGSIPLTPMIIFLFFAVVPAKKTPAAMCLLMLRSGWAVC